MVSGAGTLSDTFVLVNVPAFKTYLIRGGKERVGEQDPGGQGRAADADVSRRDAVPGVESRLDRAADDSRQGRARADAGRSGRHHEEAADNSRPAGKVVPADSIDWSTATPRTFPYTLRQPAGADNALGRVKFIFP